MGDFSREIRITPSYDYRHDPDDQRGAHGADLVFLLTGADGAISARVSTGWVARPLRGPLTPATAPLDARYAKPGVDATVRDLYPSGAYAGSHSLARRKSSDATASACDILPGESCYQGPGGFLLADEVVNALVTAGSDGVWRKLESWYQAWIAGDPLYGEAD